MTKIAKKEEVLPVTTVTKEETKKVEEKSQVFMSQYDKIVEPRLDEIEEKIAELDDKFSRLIKFLSEKYSVEI